MASPKSTKGLGGGHRVVAGLAMTADSPLRHWASYRFQEIDIVRIDRYASKSSRGRRRISRDACSNHRAQV